jgi:nucleotide-binding universal stress UspA family protein
METIVVGVDGSDCAGAALEFAAGEAALRGARLRVVSAWDIPPAIYGGGFSPGIDQATLDAFRESAECCQDAELASLRKRAPRAYVLVETGTRTYAV